jgi:hypothetical protein
VSEAEQYLRDLRRALWRHPLRRRRLLAEVADHLDAAIAAGVAAGDAPERAAREACARVGSPREVARAYAADGRPDVTVARQLRVFAVAAAVAAILLLAVARREAPPAEAHTPAPTTTAPAQR